MILKNERLEVRFRGPDCPPNSTRFDETGCVEQVVLDGKHSFCMPEQVIPTRFTCKGTGLTGELSCYGLAAEAAPGELFPKFGVGVLRQIPEGKEFSMHGDYQVVTPFPVETSCDGQTAVFRQGAVPCLGMAAQLERTYTLTGNTLTMEAVVRNTGERTLKLSEYQHNFVSIDSLPVGPGYRLQLFKDKNVGKFADSVFRAGKPEEFVKDVLRTEGNSVYWNRDVENLIMFRKAPAEELDCTPGLAWRLSHGDSPASIEEHTDFAPARIVYWSIEHCVCAEVYIDMEIQPGETAKWQRSWVFNA